MFIIFTFFVVVTMPTIFLAVVMILKVVLVITGRTLGYCLSFACLASWLTVLMIWLFLMILESPNFAIDGFNFSAELVSNFYELTSWIPLAATFVTVGMSPLFLILAIIETLF